MWQNLSNQGFTGDMKEIGSRPEQTKLRPHEIMPCKIIGVGYGVPGIRRMPAAHRTRYMSGKRKFRNNREISFCEKLNAKIF
jgi:hypothetical protein